MLIEAGPPPELSPRLVEPPKAPVRERRLRRWRPRAAFGLAVVVAAASFGIGFLVGDRGSSGYDAAGPPIPMHGVASASSAKASIVIGERDDVGNWPLLVRVRGLDPLPKGEWYELYLTRKGKLAAYCGSFSMNETGQTTVQFSIPYHLKGFDGWVVTTSKKVIRRPVLMTT